MEAVVGHLGIALVEGDEVRLIHQEGLVVEEVLGARVGFEFPFRQHVKDVVHVQGGADDLGDGVGDGQVRDDLGLKLRVEPRVEALLAEGGRAEEGIVERYPELAGVKVKAEDGLILGAGSEEERFLRGVGHRLARLLDERWVFHCALAFVL